MEKVVMILMILILNTHLLASSRDYHRSVLIPKNGLLNENKSYIEIDHCEKTFTIHLNTLKDQPFVTFWISEFEDGCGVQHVFSLEERSSTNLNRVVKVVDYTRSHCEKPNFLLFVEISHWEDSSDLLNDQFEGYLWFDNQSMAS